VGRLPRPIYHPRNFACERRGKKKKRKGGEKKKFPHRHMRVALPSPHRAAPERKEGPRRAVSHLQITEEKRRGKGRELALGRIAVYSPAR